MILKKLLQLTATLFTILIVSSAVYGQDNAADPRTKLETQLLLQIPAETDNPNFTITFTDPSQKGVTLSIDGGEYLTIVNPHTLPALGIGKHTLSFKFTDKEDSPQEAEVDIAVVPRPPIILPPELVGESKLVVKGTALAASSVKIFMTGNSINTFETTETNQDGEWEFIFEQQFEPGVYAITAYIKKNGFGSNYSEPVNFSLEGDADGESNQTVSSGPIYFRLDQINQNNLRSTIERNPDLVAYTLALLGAAFLVGVLLARALIRHDARVSEAMFRSMLNKKSHTPSESEKPAATIDPVQKEKKGLFSIFSRSKGKDLNSLKNKFEAAGFRKHGESENPEPSPDQLSLGVEQATITNSTEPEKKPAPQQKSGSTKDSINPLKSLVTDLRPGRTVVIEPDQASDDKKADEVEKVTVETDLKAEKQTGPKGEDAKISSMEQPKINQSLSKDEFLKRFKEFDPDNDETSLKLKEELKDTGIDEAKAEIETAQPVSEAETETAPVMTKVASSKEKTSSRSKKHSAKSPQKPKPKAGEKSKSKEKSIKITLTSGSFSE